MRTIFFLALFAISAVCAGQTFVAQAELSGVDKDGFYNINLSPETSRYLNGGFTNIRIVDNKNKEVPYLLHVEVPHKVSEVFRDYTVIEKKQTKNCCTTIVLHNPDHRLSNNMQLVVKNADVTKEATLLGSDDKVNWFALNQHFILTPASSREGTSEVKIVNFPLSNYQYYSLQIDDSTSAPLNILTAGYFEVQQEEGIYADVDTKQITKSDSVKDKKTYVHIRFEGSQTVDKLELAMKGATLFMRKAIVHVPKNRTAKGGKTEKYYYPVREIEITSKHSTSIELPALKVSELLIVIDNQDNPALAVDTFKAYQLKRHLTAWLNAGAKYTVNVGPPELAAPVYDISFFKDSIPDNASEIEIGAIDFYTTKESPQTSTLFTTKAYIWAAVIAVIVILGFMSVRLLNEAGSENRK